MTNRFFKTEALAESAAFRRLIRLHAGPAEIVRNFAAPPCVRVSRINFHACGQGTATGECGMDWQQEYRNGNTPWDKNAPAPALVDFLQDRGPLRGRVLVPGCGTGSDLVPLAAAGADHVTGLDIAPLAVEGAGKRIAGLGLENVTAHLADIFTDCVRPPLAGAFDAVWEHTCYCAIPPERRPDYVQAMAAALKTGGLLLGIFFLNPWDPDEDQDQGPPFRSTEESLEASFAPAFELLESWRPARAYPGREGREIVRLMRRR